MTAAMSEDLPEEIREAVQAELDKLAEQGKLEVRAPVPQCRICSDESVRTLVNDLLARLLTYRDISEILERSVNPGRRMAQLKPITKRIVETHAKNHFDFENPARKVWREIGLKRGAQMHRNFRDGVGGTVTYLGYLDVQMQRGFEDLVDPDTKVHYMDGMKAAVQLAEVERKSAGEQQQAELLARIGVIISAVKEFMPADQWAAFSERITSQSALITSQSAPKAIERRSKSDDEDEESEEYDPDTDEDYDPEGAGG